VHRLEAVRDRRQLMAHEEHLRRELKLKSLALSSLQRTIARPELCIAWIKEEDTPTHFFHAHANARRRKKVIWSLDHNGQMLVDESRKAEALFEFFNDVIGTPSQMHWVINLDLLELPQLNLSALSARFSEEEVLSIICSLPPDKVPGPDGFTARFLHVAWDIIKSDVMLTFNAFWYIYTKKFHAINEAIMVLLPKSMDAIAIRDYRPISLIIVLGMLFSKVLMNCLTPWLVELIHVTQSAFVKGQYI
jgi:hypothetical protein